MSEIEAWIAAHGVTRCPTASAAPTSARISAADRAGLWAHFEAQEARLARRAKEFALRGALMGLHRAR
ncbi:MAG TPA: hypothetical protein VGR91_19765 [Stellaceae bacterium]|nr:hypothetical protein [Stellaceae bacterium]